MHEFAMCRTIVDAVLEELDKLETDGGRLVKTHIVAGECHQLVTDNLQSVYNILCAGTRAEGSVLDIESRPITARCGKCGWNGEIHGFMYLCGACGAGGIELTGGKELYLDRLEIERNEES